MKVLLYFEKEEKTKALKDIRMRYSSYWSRIKKDL